jgi:hypothetical protein
MVEELSAIDSALSTAHPNNESQKSSDLTDAHLTASDSSPIAYIEKPSLHKAHTVQLENSAPLTEPNSAIVHSNDGGGDVGMELD